MLNFNNRYLSISFFIFSLVYFLTYINACNVLMIFSPHDDLLLYTMATRIVAGQWLGAYHPLNLSKMPMYSVFLALSMISGIPYLWMTALCRIIAIASLLRKSIYLFDKAKVILLFFGVLLLFDPTFAYELRIYRYQLPASCIIVLAASLVALFDPVSKKQHWTMELADICIFFISFCFLWFSREENILYAGFTVSALIVFCIFKKYIVNPYRNLRPVLYGLGGVALCWLSICSLNNKYYNRFILLEKTSSPYTDVVKTFHRIADPDFPDFVAGSGASPEKIRNIGEQVPFFRPMADQILALGNKYRVKDYFDRDRLELLHMLPDLPTVSHFEWIWLDAAVACGHGSDAKILAAFYTKLDYELKEAVAQGKLSFRDDVFLIGPYFLFKKDIATVIKLIPKYYFHFLPKPSQAVELYTDLMIQRSPENMGNDIFREKWAYKLKLKYIAEDDYQNQKKAKDSFVNKFWNTTTLIYAYTAVPLMHVATPAALIALIVSLRRRRLIQAVPIAISALMYLAYYVMFTTLTVASGYDAFKISYFIPAYAPMIFTAFSAISVLLNLNKDESA